MIHICYCGNERIFEGIVLSALSVMNTTEESVKFYCLTMDLSEVNPMFVPMTDAQVKTLDLIARSKNADSRAVRLDLTELYQKHLAGGKNEVSSYTPYAMLRLFMDVLPDMPDKMLYLDADVMVMRDVSELYHTEIGGFEFAGVRDRIGQWFISKKYMNSGVLLFNLEKIRETGLFRSARRMVYSRRMFMPDQSALNRHVSSRLYLDRRFNEQGKLQSDTVVKHFCKVFKFYGIFFRLRNIKQWHRELVHSKLKITAFDGIYAEYDRFAEEYALRSYASYATPKMRRKCSVCTEDAARVKQG